MSMDAFKPAPKMLSLQVESTPPGADATSSLGGSCKTPCTLSVPDTAENLSVAFALANHQPLTVPVQVTHHPGDYVTSKPSVTFDPSPVTAELQATPPPRRPARHKKPARKPRPAAPAADSAFPAPQVTAPPAR
ncbi:MAG: hypothetical protein M9932_00120 [Xanthobacteraceae bacterium]|nr:hypothetical protein [Xanthobacteraceae bacterium]